MRVINALTGELLREDTDPYWRTSSPACPRTADGDSWTGISAGHAGLVEAPAGSW